MSRWPRVALGKILDPVADRISLNPDTTYSQVTARLWGKGLALRGSLKGSEIAASQQNRVRAGQFLISKIDARHGAFGIVPAELDGAVVSNDFPVFAVNQGKALPDYVSWVSRTDWFVALCRHASEGSTNRVRLKEARFLGQEVPLPPLDEQRRIVARLDGTAAWFEAAATRIREIDTDLLQAARNVIWNAGTRADAWKPCGSFLVQRPLDVRVEPETDYPFAGVYSFGRGVFRTEIKRGSTFSYPALTRLRTDDFVYPKLMAWEGALGVVPAECDELVVSPEFPVFQIDGDQVRPIIIDTFFRDPRALPMLQSASSGTNMRRRRIQPARFLELKVPVPTPQEQKLVGALLAQRSRVVEHHRESLEGLNRLLPAMLHEAFGE